MIEKYKHINTNPWQFNRQYPTDEHFDIKLVCGSILCGCQACEGDVIVWCSFSIRLESETYFNFDDGVILGWRLSVCKQ